MIYGELQQRLLKHREKASAREQGAAQVARRCRDGRPRRLHPFRTKGLDYDRPQESIRWKQNPKLVHKLVEKGSKTKLFDLMRDRGRTRLTSGVWARALEHGDKMAQQMIDRAVSALAAGIASAQNLIDVEGVIIGGGLGVRLGHPYAKLIAEAMQPHLFHDSRPPHVHVAALGDLGGAVGAALLLRTEA